MSILKTLTKNEVIAFLGRSKRTIDTYMADGRLPYHYVNGPNGKQSEFYGADAEQLKRDLEAPMERIERAVVVATPAAPAIANEEWNGLPAKLAGLAQLAADWNEAHAPLAVYVSLKEAVRLTGLSAATIKALGVEVTTRPYGNGVRYRRADLEKL